MHHIVRIITLFEFEDGTWDASETRFDRPIKEDKRVAATDRDGAYEFVNGKLYDR